jgi:hypothetical protein|tara:strand:+ start:2104 stop:2355 length:252 start_codon:yes stop_codon:yes gene_type:complete
MSKVLDTILENYSEEEILKADGFDDAVIGIDTHMRLVYSVSKSLDILVKDGMTMEDAMEHFYYNVSGSYVGEKTPIWVEDNFE